MRIVQLDVDLYFFYYTAWAADILAFVRRELILDQWLTITLMIMIT